MVAANRPVSEWMGTLRLGDRWAAWRGGVGDGVLHRHFAAQAIIADGPLRVFDAQGRLVEAECILIDPLTPHRVQPGCEALLIYVEPGKRMEADAAELLSPVRAATSLATISAVEGQGFWATWLASPPPVADAIDPRLASALQFIENALNLGPVPLQNAASHARLSADRFRHLFADHMGMSYKRYVLWRRLRLATTHLMEGQDVTTAAHAAGFSDAAHFARTLKTTFGVTASQALVVR